MKLLAADHTEHTVTVELDNGLEQTFSGVHEDFVAEAQKELYGQSFSPSQGQPERPSKQKKVEATVTSNDFI